MRTNSKFFLQKGYIKLAFILLVVAMCFTAFIVVPFSNTQAKAYSYDFDNFDLGGNVVIGPEENQVVYNVATALPFVDKDDKNKTNILGAFYFGKEDATGIAEIKKYPTAVDSFIDNDSGLQFAPKYYNFTETLSQSLLMNDNYIATFNLENMGDYFGIGVGDTGWNTDGATGNRSSTTTTKKTNSIKISTDVVTYGKQADDISQAWRIDNGYMYTFIKIPKIANLSVSAQATVTTPYNISIHKDYANNKFIPIMNMQIGSKTIPEGQSNNFEPDFFMSDNLSARVTGDGNDHGGTSTISSPTTFVDTDKNEWIKLSFGVASTVGDVFGTFNQNFTNYISVSNVSLTFMLNKPSFRVEPNISNYDEYSNAPYKVISFEVVALSSNNSKKYAAPSFDVVLYDERGIESDYNKSIDKNSVANPTDGVAYAYTYNIPTNGEFTVKIIGNGKDNEGVVYQESSITVKNLDRGNPTTPDLDYGSGWVYNNADAANNNFELKFSNIEDTIADIDGVTNPKLKDICIQMFLVLDDENGQDVNVLLNKYPNKPEVVKISNTSRNKRVKLTSINSEFYKEPVYGRYAVVYYTRDMALNQSVPQLIYFNYEIGDKIVMQDFEIQNELSKWIPFSKFFAGNAWFNESNLVDDTNILHFRVGLSSTEYHFDMNITMSDGRLNNDGVFATLTKNDDGYYYGSIKVSDLLGDKKYYNKNNITITITNGNKTVTSKNNVLRVDIVNPFASKDSPFNKIVPSANGEEKFNTNNWYTFRDNIYFTSYKKDLFNTPFEDGGLYFYVDANEGVPVRSSDNYLSKYIFDVIINNVSYTLNDENFVKVKDSKIGIYLPLADNKDCKYDVKLTITDQAGNKTVLNNFTVKYDDRHYEINEVNVTHLDITQYGNFIAFYAADSDVVLNTKEDLTQAVTEGKATFIKPEYLSNLLGYNSLKRGKQFVIVLDRSLPDYKFLELDGIDITNNLSIKTSADKEIYSFKVGEDSQKDILQYNVSVNLFEIINIEVKYGDVVLDQNKINKINYTAKDIQLSIFNKRTGEEINTGIISNNYVGKSWVGIKNATKSQEVTIGVLNNDKQYMYKTLNDVTVEIEILKQKAEANFNISNDKLININGKTVLKHTFGKKLDVNNDLFVTYKNILDKKSPNMVFKVLNKAGKEVDINTLDISKIDEYYEMLFVPQSTEESDFAYNYDFTLKVNDAVMDLGVFIEPRTVVVENMFELNGQEKTPVSFTYGGNEYGNYVTAKIKYALRKTDINDLPINSETSLLGSLGLMDAEGNSIVGRQIPANVGNDYFFDLSQVYVDGYKDNIKLVFANEKEPIKFSIVPRPIELKFNFNNEFEYGTISKDNYSTYFNDQTQLDWINFIYGDKKELFNKLSYTINGVNADTFAKVNYLPANVNEYTINFAISEKVGNYKINQGKLSFNFKINPKAINIDLANQNLFVDSSKIGADFVNPDLLADLSSDEFKSQFLSSVNNTSDYNAFTFNGREKDFFIIEGIISTNTLVYNIITRNVDDNGYANIVCSNGLVSGNYVFIPKTSLKFRVVNVETDNEDGTSNILVNFNTPYIEVVFGTLVKEGVTNLKAGADFIKSTSNTFNPTVNDFIVTFEDKYGTTYSEDKFIKASAGEYQVKVYVNPNSKSQGIDKIKFIEDTNAIVKVLPRNVIVEFNNDLLNNMVKNPQYSKFFSFNANTLTYTMTQVFGTDIYEHEHELLNSLFVVKDADTKEVLNDAIICGKFVLDGGSIEDGSSVYYQVGKHKFAFYNSDKVPNIWITEDKENQNKNFNYNMSFVTNSYEYIFDVIRKQITGADYVVTYKGNNALTEEFGSEILVDNFEVTLTRNFEIIGDDNSSYTITIDGLQSNSLKVGQHKVNIKIELNNLNGNYILDTVDGFLNKDVVFTVTQREIAVKDIQFDEWKNFDNTNKISNVSFTVANNSDKTSSKIYFYGERDINSKVNPLITAVAKYNNVNVGVNGITYQLMIVNNENFGGADSYKFVINNDTTINGKQIAKGVSINVTDNMVELVKATAEIKPLTVKLANTLKDEVITKTYDGTRNYDALNDITFTYSAESGEIDSSKLNLSFNHIAKFDGVDANVGANNYNVFYDIYINSNFNINNIILVINDVTISNDQIISNKFSQTFIQKGVVKKIIVNLTYPNDVEHASYIHKVYDKTPNIFPSYVANKKFAPGIYNFTVEEGGTENAVTIALYPANVGDLVISDITFDLSNISFGSQVNASDDYIELAIPTSLGADLQKNFEIGNGGKVTLFAKIVRKEITVQFTSSSVNSKVYDGTTKADVKLKYGVNYVFNGILPGDSVEVKLGSAKYETPYVNENINIIVDESEIIISGNDAINYKLSNVIEGNLSGSITPRPLNLDKNNIFIYTTRYFGSKGNRYTVKVLDSIPTQSEINKFPIGTVCVYFGIDTNGLVEQDIINKLVLYPLLNLELDNSIDAPEQVIKLSSNSGDRFAIPSGIEGDEALRGAARSYKIGNLNDIFPNNTLFKKFFIDKYKITNDNIYFLNDESFNKIYDGSIKLDERVDAKVGMKENGVFVKSFLDEDIDYIQITDRNSVYSSPEANVIQDITIHLTNKIVFKNPIGATNWYEFDTLFNYEHTERNVKIVPRNVHIDIVANSKIYDGTTNAVLGKDYKLNVNNTMTGKLEGLMKIHIDKIIPEPATDSDVYYASKDVTADATNSMIFNNIKMRYVEGGECTNYRAILNPVDGKVEVSEDGSSAKYNGLRIIKRDLEIKAGDITYVYGTVWGNVDKALKDESNCKFIGFVDSTLPTVTYNFVIDNNIINNNVKLNAGTYKGAIQVNVNNDAVLNNYSYTVVPGNIIVLPKQVNVTSPYEAVSNKPTTFDFPYGTNVSANQIKNMMRFVEHTSQGDSLIKDTVELDVIKSYINIKHLPKSNTDVGKYVLVVDVINSQGASNYAINLIGDSTNNSIGDFICEISSIELFDVNFAVNVEDITLMPKLEVERIIKEHLKVNVGTDPFTIVEKTLMQKSADGKLTKVDKLNIDFSNSADSAKPNNKVTFDNLYIRVEYKTIDENGIKIANKNYIPQDIKVNTVTINRQMMDIKANNYSITYTGQIIEYPNYLIDVSSRYNNYYDMVMFSRTKDADGKYVSTVVDSPIAVGEYWILIYAIDNTYVIDVDDKALSLFNEISSADMSKDFYNKAKTNGFTVAKMLINKKTVKNNGETSLILDEPNADTQAVLNQIAELIRLSDKALTKDNIKFEVDQSAQLFVAPGTYNVKFTLQGKDSDNNDLVNVYQVVNPNFTVRIRTKVIAREDNTVIIENVDNSFIDQNLVQSGINYKVGGKADKEAIIQGTVAKSMGKPYSMTYVQFNNEDLSLKDTITLKVKVNSKYADKNLYLVDDSGLCTLISDVDYVKENGNTYAVFNTNKLGWLVQADSPSNPITSGVIAAVSLIGVALGILVIMLIVLSVQANKMKKFTK